MYGGLLLAMLVWVLIQASLAKDSAARDQEEWFIFVQPASLMAVGLAAVLAGYWYVRNFLDLGNPLGPFHIGIAGVTIFPGSMDLEEIRRTTALSGLFSPGKLTHWAAWWMRSERTFQCLSSCSSFRPVSCPIEF